MPDPATTAPDGSSASLYRRFAENEARGKSVLYEEWAHRIADSPEILGLLDALPAAKRQPNLLFAAVRHVGGVPADWPALQHRLATRWDKISSVIRSQATQTNEPGRCATLAPVLSRLPGKLALIEVGASAGLCLLPDRYAYDYGGHQLRPDAFSADTPVFPCEVSPGSMLPDAMPHVVWRAGLDLHPLDVQDAGQMAWLTDLVWPEQTGRASRLQQAVRIARADPPLVVRGDLRDGVAALAAAAPKDATLVVFHTAVLAYLPEAARRTFTTSVLSFCDYWIANEAPHVVPDIARQAPDSPVRGRFILGVNGMPVAWTDPHGASLDWIGEPSIAWPG